MKILYCLDGKSHFDSYSSFNRNGREQIQWILILLTFNKASELECCTEQMATLLRIIFAFKRQCQGAGTVDIDNIDVQKGPLNQNAVLKGWQSHYASN
jgi:hypothetical protein